MIYDKGSQHILYQLGKSVTLIHLEFINYVSPWYMQRSKSPCSKSRQQNVHLYTNTDVSDTEVWSEHCLESVAMWDSSVLFLFARTFKNGYFCFTKYSLCCHIVKFNPDGLGTDDLYQVNTQAQMQTSRNCEMINHETDVYSISAWGDDTTEYSLQDGNGGQVHEYVGFKFLNTDVL